MPEDGFVSVTVDKDHWERLRRLPLKRLGYKTRTGFVRALLLKTCDELEDEQPRRSAR